MQLDAVMQPVIYHELSGEVAFGIIVIVEVPDFTELHIHLRKVKNNSSHFLCIQPSALAHHCTLSEALTVLPGMSTNSCLNAAKDCCSCARPAMYKCSTPGAHMISRLS